MWTKRLIFSFAILFMVAGCSQRQPAELYFYFADSRWERRNILSFEFPVEQENRVVDVVLTGIITPGFEWEKLDLNMTMKTPSGEERINEYTLKVKSPDGTFLGELNNGKYHFTHILKKQLNLSEKGVLTVQIENLVPRLYAEGVSGIGLKMVDSGK